MSYINTNKRLRRRRARFTLWIVAPLVLVLVNHATAHPPRNLFPAYTDEATAALWLFDEPLDPAPDPPRTVTPWYYTQTITDASSNYYDLHRLHGGAIEAGRFGHALRINASHVGPGIELAANFASEPRVYGVFLPADHEFVPGSSKEQESMVNYFWYTTKPDQLVGALLGQEWTVEFWMRTSGPSRDACLMDGGQGKDALLRVEFADHAKTCRLTFPTASGLVNCDLAGANIADGQWHHLAFVESPTSSAVATYVDGRLASTTEFFPALNANPSTMPGLATTSYRQLGFNTRADAAPVAGLGASLAGLGTNATSIRFRGFVKAPATGEIRFETDSNSGLHLAVDDRPLIYGWFGRAAMYRRSPRWGEVRMQQGELYPVLIEMQKGDEDVPFAQQRLYWSWTDHPREPVPDSAWVHTQQDARDASADQGGTSPTALMQNRFNWVIGSDRDGQAAFDGWLDELRISKVARYVQDFTPVTHSLNYGPNSPPPAQRSGPPLLFANSSAASPLALGKRKHVFIDDALVDKMSGLTFTVNRPQHPIAIQPVLPNGDHSFFDLNGEVALFAPAGYEGREDFAFLWVSADGVHFRLHNAVAPESGEKTPRPIATNVPAWGRMARDDNPQTPEWARFKYTAGVPHRGIYLLVSPDAVHWRRNETIMLQVGTGGESHWYWDDQTGEYRYLLKWDHGPGGRQSVEASTRQCFEAWPLERNGDPETDLATPLGYMPSRFPPDKKLGEVYRSRGIKYPWAPDVYLAFPWRFDPVTKARQVELAVSRDGKRWTHFSDNWYMPAEFEYEGQQVHEVTSVDGMLRRGEEIWQYADYSTGRHDGSKPGWRVRLTQRLDGFVSLDAAAEAGEFVTRPVLFSGDTLSLNVAVEKAGFVKVALLDVDGTPAPGFSLEDCEPACGDSTALPVRWKTHKPLSELAGKPVRLKFRMQRSKLYALQFN